MTMFTPPGHSGAHARTSSPSRGRRSRIILRCRLGGRGRGAACSRRTWRAAASRRQIALDRARVLDDGLTHGGRDGKREHPCGALRSPASPCAVCLLPPCVPVSAVCRAQAGRAPRSKWVGTNHAGSLAGPLRRRNFSSVAPLGHLEYDRESTLSAILDVGSRDAHGGGRSISSNPRSEVPRTRALRRPYVRCLSPPWGRWGVDFARIKF